MASVFFFAKLAALGRTPAGLGVLWLVLGVSYPLGALWHQKAILERHYPHFQQIKNFMEPLSASLQNFRHQSPPPLSLLDSSLPKVVIPFNPELGKYSQFLALFDVHFRYSLLEPELFQINARGQLEPIAFHARREFFFPPHESAWGGPQVQNLLTSEGRCFAASPAAGGTLEWAWSAPLVLTHGALVFHYELSRGQTLEVFYSERADHHFEEKMRHRWRLEPSARAMIFPWVAHHEGPLQITALRLELGPGATPICFQRLELGELAPARPLGRGSERVLIQPEP